jgi:diacylglycerol O-acyltransferase / wax synthase
MGQSHMDTLSVVDTSFLNLETGTTHMHVGGISIFEGPELDCDQLFRHVESRLHLVPRYRQKVAWPGLELGRPMWIDDPCFNLDYHVRHTALPKPGNREQLRNLASRVFSQQLDRSKPLWEMWLVEGMEDDRFAVISKTHHALIDGMSGVDLLALLFDVTREPREVEPPERPWQPAPAPGGLGLKATAASEIATRPYRMLRKAASAVATPQRTMKTVAEGLQGINDLLIGPMLSPAPDVPLNQSTSPHRRVAWKSFELADFKAVKNELGGTVNDVVLTVVSGALREWLRKRGTRTEGLELRAMVPVSTRTDDQRHKLGNQVAAMRAPLPVYAEDPKQCLDIVREQMQGLKESKQAVGADVLANLQEFAPPTLLAMGSRINFSTRLFNTIVTNVPGPQMPIYLMGREMLEMVPLGFLAEGHTAFFAIMSYNGKLDISILGDRESLDDIDDLADGLERALDELKAAAGIAAPKQKAEAKPRRTSPASGSGRSRGTTRSKPKTATRARATSGTNGRPH